MCQERTYNAAFYTSAVLPFFIVLLVKEGLKVILFLICLLNERTRRSTAIQYFQRNVLVLPLTAVFGFKFFLEYFVNAEADSARLLVMDVLLEDAPQLVINVMFMMLIQSTGSAINQVSLFFTLAMTLSALGNLAWRLVTLVRATKRDFGGGKGGGDGMEEDKDTSGGVIVLEEGVAARLERRVNEHANQLQELRRRVTKLEEK